MGWTHAAALACIGVACEPQPSATPIVVQKSVEPAVDRPDDCRRDIPDCSAACALRETHHLEFIDWYDRRCAAVILGKNPDQAAGASPPPQAKASKEDCDPPFSLDAQGFKTWKRECL